ncbi:MAG: YraN family protein [Chitinophagaceae bacterium]|nr:YraN family protein [Chitinophagaceae bacterium]
MLSQNLETGKKGEDIATHFLIQKGYTIQERNWRHKHWEVDIIASKGTILHFIEVKTRTNMHYGYPEEGISKEKMQHLKNAAMVYQFKHQRWKYIQFDAIAIQLQGLTIKEIMLIEDIYF